MEKLIIVDETALKNLKEEIAEALVLALESRSNGTYTDKDHLQEWVDEAVAKEILGYRSKTKMQELRNAGAIIFSKFGRKIRYQRKSLVNYIEKNIKIRPDYEG